MQVIEGRGGKLIFGSFESARERGISRRLRVPLIRRWSSGTDLRQWR